MMTRHERERRARLMVDAQRYGSMAIRAFEAGNRDLSLRLDARCSARSVEIAELLGCGAELARAAYRGRVLHAD